MNKKLSIIKNAGFLDKILRLIVVTIVVALYFTKIISGINAIVLGIVAVTLVATSLFNFCPLYKILRINTHKNLNK